MAQGEGKLGWTTVTRNARCFGKIYERNECPVSVRWLWSSLSCHSWIEVWS